MATSPTPLLDLLTCQLGEGPWWDVATRTLYLVDIAGHAIHSWTPAAGRHARLDTGAETSFALLDARGSLVAGIGDGIFVLEPGLGRRLLARPDMHPENRFNDAACDPRGRLWAGTMHVEASRDRAPTGALYRLRASGDLDAFATDIGIANGLGWSPDGATMYFAETHLGTVWAYDYDLDTGRPSHRRGFARVPIEVGVPDGLTVDSAGRVHVAIWRGGRINVYAPDGGLDEVIAMPVPSATSCCFGGDDLRTLYITTDGRRLSGERPDDPLPGRVLAMARDVPGLPGHRMRPLDEDRP